MIFSRQFDCEFAILVVLAVIAVFLFPVAGGSYSAMHGPVTALRSATGQLKIWLLLALARFSLFGRFRFASLIGFFALGIHGLSSRPSIPDNSPVLRC